MKEQVETRSTEIYEELECPLLHVGFDPSDKEYALSLQKKINDKPAYILRLGLSNSPFMQIYYRDEKGKVTAIGTPENAKACAKYFPRKDKIYEKGIFNSYLKNIHSIEVETGFTRPKNSYLKERVIKVRHSLKKIFEKFETKIAEMKKLKKNTKELEEELKQLKEFDTMMEVLNSSAHLFDNKKEVSLLQLAGVMQYGALFLRITDGISIVRPWDSSSSYITSLLNKNENNKDAYLLSNDILYFAKKDEKFKATEIVLNETQKIYFTISLEINDFFLKVMRSENEIMKDFIELLEVINEFYTKYDELTCFLGEKGVVNETLPNYIKNLGAMAGDTFKAVKHVNSTTDKNQEDIVTGVDENYKEFTLINKDNGNEVIKVEDEKNDLVIIEGKVEEKNPVEHKKETPIIFENKNETIENLDEKENYSIHGEEKNSEHYRKIYQEYALYPGNIDINERQLNQLNVELDKKNNNLEDYNCLKNTLEKDFKGNERTEIPSTELLKLNLHVFKEKSKEKSKDEALSSFLDFDIPTSLKNVFTSKEKTTDQLNSLKIKLYDLIFKEEKSKQESLDIITKKNEMGKNLKAQERAAKEELDKLQLEFTNKVEDFNKNISTDENKEYSLNELSEKLITSSKKLPDLMIFIDFLPWKSNDPHDKSTYLKDLNNQKEKIATTSLNLLNLSIKTALASIDKLDVHSPLFKEELSSIVLGSNNLISFGFIVKEYHRCSDLSGKQEFYKSMSEYEKIIIQLKEKINTYLENFDLNFWMEKKEKLESPECNEDVYKKESEAFTTVIKNTYLLFTSFQEFLSQENSNAPNDFLTLVSWVDKGCQRKASSDENVVEEKEQKLNPKANENGNLNELNNDLANNQGVTNHLALKMMASAKRLKIAGIAIFVIGALAALAGGALFGLGAFGVVSVVALVVQGLWVGGGVFATTGVALGVAGFFKGRAAEKENKGPLLKNN